MKSHELEELRSYRNASPEAKLSALCHAMIMRISTVRGYSHLLKEANLQGTLDLPEEHAKWLDRLVQAADDLYEILEAITGCFKTDLEH